MLLVSAQGCSSSSEIAARKAAEAAAHLEGGNPAAALWAARKATEERDDIADYWKLLGRAELQSGNLAGAYQAYRRAIELDPADPESLQILADIALRAGQTREAVKAADQLLALQPTLTRPRLVKGMAALIERDDKTAERLADEILAAEPADEVGKVLKARVLGRRGDFATAVAILDNAGTARTEIVLATLVELHRNASNGPKLAETLAELNTNAPTDDRVFELIFVQYKIGKTAAARETLAKRLQVRPKDLALHDRAFNVLSEYDPSYFDATPAGFTDKSSVALRILAARILLGRTKSQQAFDVLEPLIGAGTPPDVWSLYAVALDTIGKAGAPGLVDRVLATDETNGYALLLRSAFAKRRGDFVAALRDAQQVVGEDPENLQAKLAVIDVYRARGDRARMRQLFEECIKRHPGSTVALRAYISFLREANDRDRALRVAQAFAFLNPERLDGWRILQQMCDTDACRRDSQAGLGKAAGNFTPPGSFDSNRSGIWGRL